MILIQEISIDGWLMVLTNGCWYSFSSAQFNTLFFYKRLTVIEMAMSDGDWVSSFQYLLWPLNKNAGEMFSSLSKPHNSWPHVSHPLFNSYWSSVPLSPFPIPFFLIVLILPVNYIFLLSDIFSLYLLFLYYLSHLPRDVALRTK